MSDHNTESTSNGMMMKIVATMAVAFAFVVMGSSFTPQDSHADHDSHDDHATDPHHSDHIDGHEDGSIDTFENEDGSSIEMTIPVDAVGDIASADPHHDLRKIISFEDDCYRVDVYATVDGPRFTVYEDEFVQPIMTLVERESIIAFNDDIIIPDIADATATQLMYADPAYWGLDH